MSNKLMIPMIVLAHHLKRPLQVPAINPNYKTALASYLGKDSTPSAFNSKILLKKGIHLHFVLPSALKKGSEITNDQGEKVFDYPAVPDRFIVTRLYVKNGKIETSCNIVESNFYSLDSTYGDSITIPKFDDLRERHRFRYLGRTYQASKVVPNLTPDSGYFDKITAIGPGDPLFSTYYPSCSSVFGFYDDLADVPLDAVLTYFVIGYYSNAENDIFQDVKSLDDMKKTLTEFNLSVSDEEICNSCILFGEIGGIDLTKDYPPALGEINVGIGNSSSEALSAIIKDTYYKDNPAVERFITSIQYDTADEASQLDGNFKIDDDIHFRTFNRNDSLENAFSLKLPKDIKDKNFAGFARPYSDLIILENEMGKLRRTLEYKKNSLYYIWEIYEGASKKNQELLKQHMEPIIKEITILRNDIDKMVSKMTEQKKDFIEIMNEHGIEWEITSSEPFYLTKDPVVMLFGNGMNRTYAFGEEGRFESDNTLFCLTKPLTSDISSKTICSYFKDLSHSSNICDNYLNYAVTAVLLDTVNILPNLKLNPIIKEKFSPILLNNNPMEQITLFMQWESNFFPNYNDSNPENSKLEYGNTNYNYYGTMSEQKIVSDGISVITPHGIYNLQDKLKKYIEYHDDSTDVSALTEKIKDIAAVSQNLGGFNIGLTALKYAFQYPIDIDPKDEYSKKIAECLNAQGIEPAHDRLAVQNNTKVFPLREGFFGLSKLALITSFGLQRKIIDDDLAFKGKRHYSENLHPIKNDFCFFPLAVTTSTRLSTYFLAARDNKVLTSPFLDSTPIIGIFLPDMLNRNLNVFSNLGENIGTLKTTYRKLNHKKIIVGRFVYSPNAPSNIDLRIRDFISELTKDNTAFAEVMMAIDNKLNHTMPLAQNNFIFGRALVLAEVSVELEFFGSPEWSKKEEDIGKFDDVGLVEQAFVVKFGDRDRVTDGVCCGFYNGFSQGFRAFGDENNGDRYLNAPAFSIKSAEGPKNVTLLFDPMLKVTINTGFMPVKQLELYAEHIDFSKFQLFSAELNTLISGEDQAELPNFAQGTDISRFYPKLVNGTLTYSKIDIVKPSSAIETIGKTMITDGVIIKRE